MAAKKTLAELEIKIPVDVAGARRDVDKIKSMLNVLTVHSGGQAKSFSNGWSKAFGDVGKAWARPASDIVKGFSSVSREGVKSFTTISREGIKAAGILSKSFSTFSRDAGKGLGSIGKESEKVSGQISRNLTKAFSAKPTSGVGGSVKSIMSSLKDGLLMGAGMSLFDNAKDLMIAPFRGIGQAIADASGADTVQRKFKAVFEESAGDADKFAKDYAKKFGRGLTDIRGTMARFQDTLVPVGFSVEDASSMSQKMTSLSGDLAVSEGIGSAEAADRIVSGMVGNHESLRKFGVIITETSLNAKLLAMGIEGGSKKATEQEKVLARLNMVMDGTRQAQGAATRGAGSYATSMEGLFSVMTDFSAMIGKAFMPAAARIAAFFRDMVSKVQESIGPVDTWGETLSGAVGNVLEMIKPVGDFFTGGVSKIGEYFGGIVGGLKSITADWATFKGGLGDVWELFKNGASIAFEYLKSGFLQGISGIAGGIAALFGVSDSDITDMISGWIDMISGFVDSLRDMLGTIVETMDKAMGTTAEDKISRLSEEDQAKYYAIEEKKRVVTVNSDRHREQDSLLGTAGASIVGGLTNTLNGMSADGSPGDAMLTKRGTALNKAEMSKIQEESLKELEAANKADYAGLSGEAKIKADEKRKANEANSKSRGDGFAAKVSSGYMAGIAGFKQSKIGIQSETDITDQLDKTLIFLCGLLLIFFDTLPTLLTIR